jgi:hypothetical protein
MGRIDNYVVELGEELVHTFAQRRNFGRRDGVRTYSPVSESPDIFPADVQPFAEEGR